MGRTVYFVDELFHPVQTGAQRVYANQMEFFRRHGVAVRVVVALALKDDERKQQFLDTYRDADIRVIELWKESPSLHARFCSQRSPYRFDNLVESYRILSKVPAVQRELQAADLFIADYVFKTPLLECLGGRTLAICNTIDVQAMQFPQLEGRDGVDRQLWAQERALLRHWDTLLMISRSEAEFVRRELPDQRVLFVPQYVPNSTPPVREPMFDIGYVSSRHPPNVRNLYRFYFDVFLPWLKVKGYRLGVAGSVCEDFTVRDPQVVRLGWVDSLEDFYASTRLVVCPTWSGAGLNMKCLEAMAHGKPVLLTERGRASLARDARELPAADEPHDMARAIADLLDNPDRLADAARASAVVVSRAHAPHHHDEAWSHALSSSSARSRRLAARPLLQRVIGRVFDTDKEVSGRFLLLQLRRGVVFYLANHLLPHVPLYRLRYWYLRRFLGYRIGRKTSIAPTTFFTGNLFTIGDHSVINRQCYLDAREGLTIGSNVSVSNQVYIQSATHDAQAPDFAYVPGPVAIEDFAWIGARAVILPGVRIGEGAVVAAAAVVSRDVEPYTIVAGVPARVLGQRSRALRYTLDYFPFFDTDYAPYFGSARPAAEAGQVHHLCTYLQEHLDWHTADPRWGTPVVGDRLRLAGEQGRAFTRVGRPAQATQLVVRLERPRGASAGNVAVVCDWRTAADERTHLDVLVLSGPRADGSLNVPETAAELVASLKNADGDSELFVRRFALEWKGAAAHELD